VFHSGAGLGSGGDAVKIYLPDGTLVDSVTYTAGQAGYDESLGDSTDDEVYHTLVRCGDGAGAANTNSNDATTSWYSVKTASFGSSNASACDTSTDATAAVRYYNLQPPTGLPGTCSPSAPSGSDQIALPDAAPWPTSNGVTSVDNVCAFITPQDPTGNDMNGLVFSSDGSVLWAAQNKNHLWKLVKSGGKYVPATDDDWGSGKAITFTGTDPNTSQPDSEGLTVGGNGDLFVTSERDNHDNNVSKDEVLEYDPTAAGTTLTPVRQWDLTSEFVPSVIAATGDDANLGFEGVTYVPDSFLTAHGFHDQHLDKLYDPTDYPGHGSGLFFLAMEKNGHVYAYALNSDGTYQRVADIDTGIDGTRRYRRRAVQRRRPGHLGELRQRLRSCRQPAAHRRQRQLHPRGELQPPGRPTRRQPGRLRHRPGQHGRRWKEGSGLVGRRHLRRGQRMEQRPDRQRPVRRLGPRPLRQHPSAEHHPAADARGCVKRTFLESQYGPSTVSISGMTHHEKSWADS
jgi:hypothetical protein